MNIDEAIERAIDEASLTRSPKTAKMYRLAMNKFRSYLGGRTDVHVSNLDVDTFTKYPSWLVQDGYAKGTVAVYLAGVRFLWDWLVIQGLISPSYADSLRYTKSMHSATARREARIPRIPEKGAVEAIIAAAESATYPEPIKSRNLAVIEVLHCSGCRNEELTRMMVRDFNLSEMICFVTGKGDKERIVYLSKKAIEAVQIYWQNRPQKEKNAPAFCRHDRGAGKKAKPISTNTVRTIVDEAVSLAGLDSKFTPHYFRHAFAAKMLRDTGNLALVQDLLGHSSPNATRIYAHIDQQDLQGAHKRSFSDKDNNGQK